MTVSPGGPGGGGHGPSGGSGEHAGSGNHHTPIDGSGHGGERGPADGSPTNHQGPHANDTGGGNYSPHAPGVASDLNDAFVHGHPTTDLARQLADLSTHHIGNADRVVLGKWEGQDAGYIGEARNNGGIYFDTGREIWDYMGQGLNESKKNTLGWEVNEQFLRAQMENHVGGIDYILDREKYSSLEDMAIDRPGSFSAMEVEFLNKNAASYGYQRVGDSWVYVIGGQR